MTRDAVELIYRAIDGEVVRVPLLVGWRERFEAVAPVRGFPSWRGQRNFPGLWWSATSGEHVGFESWLERDHAMMLDFDPHVIGFSSQPFWLCWSTDQGPRRHAPDFFARLHDDSACVVDVRPDQRIRPSDAEAFAMTAQACASVGWDYRRVGERDPILVANIRWLSGYRHSRCEPGSALVRALREVFAEPAGLLRGARQLGDPLAILPALFHLLWMGDLVTDLTTTPLSLASTVWSRRDGGRG
ncbi:TnsA-like heteromeric transposase endonuclease subunit [Nonomuraea longicatena]|uniref:TnsA-like heteromeric transposase endonuclease subunit n=1 Tax=Nonomuraea longicatena TaxID=83682 RepID=A0ABP4A392_9ACTN